MIFSFWTQSLDHDTPAPSESAKAWHSVFPEFRVFDDSIVIDLLSGMSNEYAAMYRRISLPACKSDIARLVLVHHYGGMYIDIHAHPGDTASLAYVFSLLSEYEMVLCDQVLDRKDKNDMSIANGALWCRKNSSMAQAVLRRVLRGMLDHMKKEDETGEYVKYNLSALCGSWAILDTVYDTSRPRPLPLRAEAEGKISRYQYYKDSETAPFHFYRHYDYRKPGLHWSELQKTQRLFTEKSTMHGSDLISWRQSLGITRGEAAARLGCGHDALEAWEQGATVPRYIALACAAIESGLQPIKGART